MPIRSRQPRASSASPPRRPGPAGSAPQRADADVLGDRPEREDAVGLPVAGHQRRCRRSPPLPSGAAPHRTAPAASRSDPGRRARPAPRPRPHGPPAPDRPAARPLGPDARPAAVVARRQLPVSALLAASATLPIAATSESRVNSPAGRDATTRPSRITTTRSDAARISPRRCEISTHAPPPATNRRTKARSWSATTASRDGSARPGSPAGRHVGHREGARDLDQLALPDGEVADQIAGPDAVAGEDLVQPSTISRPARCRQPRPLRPRARPAFSATVRFGQSDSSWNTQRTPWRCAATTPQPAVASTPST